MKRVHHPARVGAAAPDQRLYPPGAVGGDDLYGPPLLAGELVEEEVQHLLAVALVRPDEASPVVVDDDGEVPVALLVACFVYADPAQAVEPGHAPLGLDLVADAPADPAHAVPLDPRYPGDGGHAAPHRKARDPVLEVAREARPVARPRHPRRVRRARGT